MIKCPIMKQVIKWEIIFLTTFFITFIITSTNYLIWRFHNILWLWFYNPTSSFFVAMISLGWTIIFTKLLIQDLKKYNIKKDWIDELPYASDFTAEEIDNYNKNH